MMNNIHIGSDCIVLSIDEINNTVVYDFTLFIEWKTTSTSNKNNRKKYDNKYVTCSSDDMIDGWKPEVVFYYIKESTNTETTYYVNHYLGSYFVIMNWILTINELLELKCFPFDRQILRIKFLILKVKNFLPYDSLISRPSVMDKLIGATGLTVNIRPTSWILHKMYLDIQTLQSSDDEPETEATFTVFTERNSFYYVINFGVVLFLIVLSALPISAIPYKEIADRMSITVSLLLTMVAFKFVMTSYIPPTSYLTTLDIYMLITILMLSLIIAENFFVTIINDHLASTFDICFFYYMTLFWILFHVYIVIGTRLNLFRKDWNSLQQTHDDHLKSVDGLYITDNKASY